MSSLGMVSSQCGLIPFAPDARMCPAVRMDIRMVRGLDSPTAGATLIYLAIQSAAGCGKLWKTILRSQDPAGPIFCWPIAQCPRCHAWCRSWFRGVLYLLSSHQIAVFLISPIRRIATPMMMYSHGCFGNWTPAVALVGARSVEPYDCPVIDQTIHGPDKALSAVQNLSSSSAA